MNYSAPVRAIWILAKRMSLISGWWYAREQHAFSIAEVEAIDTKGVNVALLSRGAGATVSSTYYGDGLSGEEHDLYWPLHYDLGDKWVRVNYWESVLQWCYVEPNEKGRYYIDPRADRAITETVKNGANIIMALDYGNFRAVFQRALETGDLTSGLRLAVGLYRFWVARGYLTEARAWLEIALPLSQFVPPATRRTRSASRTPLRPSAGCR